MAMTDPDVPKRVWKDEECMLAMELCSASAVPMAMKAAIELGALEAMSKGDEYQTSEQIIMNLTGIENPSAPSALDRILRVLASHSLLRSRLDTDAAGRPARTYALTPLAEHLVPDKDGVSLGPLLLMNQDAVFMDTWQHLKCAVTEGSQPFVKAHGVNAFEYPAKDQRFNAVFNKAMSGHSGLMMKNILNVYDGFKDLQEIVDVGGGIGLTSSLIVEKYPHIKATNFDMPHVVTTAPPHPGVTHVGGDMFASVPSGQAIFMKWILHDWSDELCLQLLKNCHKALPENGKVIIVDAILPVEADTQTSSRVGYHVDLLMLAYNPGGKERTLYEFKDLAKQSGFEGGIKVICTINSISVMEFYKNK